MSSHPRVQELTEPEAGTSHKGNHIDTGVKKDTLSRLVEKQLDEINAISSKIELWTKYRDDYKELEKLIDKIQDKVSHPYRIPVAGSKLAFVDGSLVHTNEFYVLLGDNYFALRSARQSSKIINRRLEEIRQNLEKSQEAKRKTEDWLQATQDHRKEKEEFVEIIETM